MSEGPGYIASNKLVLLIPHARRLGLKFLEKSGDSLVIEMPYNPELEVLPGSGLMANGAITTLLDTALGAVVYDRFDSYRRIVTLDLRVDFFEKPRPFSSVTAKTRCLKVTDRIVFVQGDVFCAAGDAAIAHGVAVFSYADIAGADLAGADIAGADNV